MSESQLREAVLVARMIGRVVPQGDGVREEGGINFEPQTLAAMANRLVSLLDEGDWSLKARLDFPHLEGNGSIHLAQPTAEATFAWKASAGGNVAWGKSAAEAVHTLVASMLSREASFLKQLMELEDNLVSAHKDLSVAREALKERKGDAERAVAECPFLSTTNGPERDVSVFLNGRNFGGSGATIGEALVSLVREIAVRWDESEKENAALEAKLAGLRRVNKGKSK